MPQKKNNTSSIVYSTDSSFIFSTDDNANNIIPPAEQKLTIKLDKKHRCGKMVTIVEGYQGNDIEDPAKQLKKYCGTGGSVKDGSIIVQGDNREKIRAWLLKNGYKHVKNA